MINDIIDSGIFVATRKPNVKIYLENKEEATATYLDYFDFEKILINKFDIDKVEKILHLLNCGNKVLIDFYKPKAFKIADKDINYNKLFWNSHGSINAVQRAYNDYITYENQVDLDNQYPNVNEQIISKYQTEEI